MIVAVTLRVLTLLRQTVGEQVCKADGVEKCFTVFLSFAVVVVLSSDSIVYT